jgi:hypothetical protein
MTAQAAGAACFNPYAAQSRSESSTKALHRARNRATNDVDSMLPSAEYHHVFRTGAVGSRLSSPPGRLGAQGPDGAERKLGYGMRCSVAVSIFRCAGALTTVNANHVHHGWITRGWEKISSSVLKNGTSASKSNARDGSSTRGRQSLIAGSNGTGALRERRRA